MPELPEWRPLDQIAESLSEGQQGRVVGIVATETAVEAGWAEKAALELAKAWTEVGRKVMLVDGSLQRPSLHAVSGVPNGEGLSDATLFGASVERVAQPVEGEAYFVIPAGTAVADTNAVVRSRRWDQIARSSVEAGVTLGVFLRDGESGTAAFLGSASEIIVLGGREDQAPSSVRDLEPLVSFVAGLDPDAEDVEEEGGEGKEEGDDAAPLPVESELSAGALRRTAEEGRHRVTFLAVFVLVVVVVLLALFGILPVPGLSAEPPVADAAAGASKLLVR
jgi:hypothetical protein